MLLPAGAAGQYQVAKVPVVREMLDIPVNSYWQPMLGELLLVIAVLLTIACMFGCYVGWCCRNIFPSKIEKLEQKKKNANQKATKNTQSQMTYKWKYATPRFTPLAEHAHGAWGEIESPFT